MHYLRFTLALLMLNGCSFLQEPTVHDPSKQLTRTDFKNMTQSPSFEEEEPEDIPFIPVKPRSGLCLTLDLDGKIPLEKVAKEMAKQLKSGYFLQEQSEVSLSYHVIKRDLEDVLEDLSLLTGKVFRFEEGLLSVRADSLYFQTYSFNYPTVQREAISDVSINTNSTGLQNNPQGYKNASQTQIKSTSQSSLWHDINSTLAQILGVTPAPVNHSQPPSPLTKDTPTTSLQKEGKKRNQPSYSINHQAGHIHVYATHKQHKIIEELLDKIKMIFSSQILIEAKIVEIRLNDEYRSGINWSSLRKNLGITGNMGSLATNSSLPGLGSAADYYQFTVRDGKEFSSVLTFMETFGTVRTLSSPRLTVLNNQAAVLKVADNLTFFRVKTDVRTTYSNSLNNGYQENLVSESQIDTVPVGFIMTVQPSIDPHSREIILYLKPTITSVKQLRNDPSVELTAKRYKLDGVKSEIPVISVREIDSILRMDSGSITILGGLMQESANNISSGLPGFGETPLRFLTNGKSDDHVITELVIFIKATIAGKRKKFPHDTHLYQKFFNDPRPLTTVTPHAKPPSKTL